MSTIFKIQQQAQTFHVQKAKVVSGKFGAQLWLAATDANGQEGAVYLPWATGDGNMSGVVQQLVRAGIIGPEDFTTTEGTYYDQLQGETLKIERVFKDGKQFINVDRVAPLLAAATRELSLEEQGKQDDAEFFAKLATPAAPAAVQRALQAQPKVVTRQKESADARIKRAFDHVMDTYGEALATMEPDLARAIVALTATHAIAYERE